MCVFRKDMRRLFALLLCLCLLVSLSGCYPGSGGATSGSAENKEPANVKVMTLNVAYYDGEYPDGQHLKDLAYANQTMEEDYTFAERADRLRSLLKYYVPDVFFLNEFNFAWWKEVISAEDGILRELTQYDYVRGKSTGLSENGEGEGYKDLYNMLFFDQTRFVLLDSGYFTIIQRKSGWYDHCTWAKLQDKVTGQVAIYAVTHLPTVPDTQWAVKGLQATTVAVEELAKIADGLPIILGGDFNTTEKSRGYYTYKYMVGKAGYQDACHAAPQTDSSGTARIWGSAMSNNGSRIDYIFVNGADVKDYRVASGAFLADDSYVEEVSAAELKTGKYYDISDHLPVIATVTLSGGESVMPEAYSNLAGKDDVEAKPTGSFAENGGTAERLIFSFEDAAKYVGNVNQKGFEASLVQDETHGTVLKLQATDHITSGYISIDYGALMEACGLTAVDAKQYSVVKITYLANTSFTSETGVLKLCFLRKGIQIPAETTALGLSANGRWTTQTLALSLLPGAILGQLDALTVLNTGGALKGDAIYIASIEFLK